MVRLFSFLDYAVSGEVDHSVPALCRQLLERGGAAVDPAHLPEGVYGASSRDAANPAPKQRAVVADLDALPTRLIPIAGIRQRTEAGRHVAIRAAVRSNAFIEHPLVEKVFQHARVNHHHPPAILRLPAPEIRQRNALTRIKILMP